MLLAGDLFKKGQIPLQVGRLCDFKFPVLHVRLIT